MGLGVFLSRLMGGGGSLSEDALLARKFLEGEPGFRDRVAPDSYVEERDYVQIGGRFVRYLCVRDIRTGVHLGGDLMFVGEKVPGVWTSVTLVPLPPEGVAALRRAQTEDLGMMDYEARRGKVPSPGRAARVAALREAIEQVEVLQRPIHRMTMVIAISAGTLEELDWATREVRNWAHARGILLMSGMFIQRALEYTLLPSASPRVPVYRNVFASTLGPSMPFRHTRYYDPRGIPYGVHARSGTLVVLDPFRAVNPSHLVLGVQGSGKSVFMKMLVMTVSLLGAGRVIVLDPEREYEQIVRLLGGEYVVLGREHSLNLFDLGMEGDWEQWKDTSLALLKGFMAIALGRALTPSEGNAIVPRVFLQVAEHARGRQVPTLDDFQRALETEGYRELAQLLTPFTHPDLWGKFFSRRSTIDVSGARVVGFSLDPSVPEDMVAPFVWAAISLVWRMMSPADPVFFMVDEAWYLLRNAGVAAMLGEVSRRFPKRGGALVLATHHVSDFARTADAQIVGNTAGNIVLFRMPPVMVREVGNLFGLTDVEREQVPTWPSGQGLLLADHGTIRVPIYVPVPPMWQPLMFTRGRDYMDAQARLRS